jgi:hypothetical protein
MTIARLLHIIRTVVLVCLILHTNGCFFRSARIPIEDLPEDGRFHFRNPTQKYTWVPFQFVNNVVIIPVHINDSDSLTVILDSGLNTTIISELSIGDTLSLNYAGRVLLRGLGVGDPLPALYSTGNNVRIAGLYGRNHTIYVLLQDIFHLSQSMGMRIHGLVGYDLFKDVIVEINYRRRQIRFHNPAFYRYNESRLRRENAAVIPIEIINNKAYIPASITVANDTEIPLRLLLDTGASYALWLHPDSDPRIQIPDDGVDMYLGKGLSGDIHGKIARIKRVTIGHFTFDNPIVSFPDSIAMQGIYEYDSRHGSIGSEILRRFKVVIDYHNKKLTLSPQTDLHEAFRYNMSGMEINTPFPGFPVFIISKITENSPAAEAKLQEGDQIYIINGKRAVGLELSDILDMLIGKEGRRITISVVRDGKLFRTDFRLRSML